VRFAPLTEFQWRINGAQWRKKSAPLKKSPKDNSMAQSCAIETVSMAHQWRKRLVVGLGLGPMRQRHWAPKRP